jgi:hypothetical protein
MCYIIYIQIDFFLVQFNYIYIYIIMIKLITMVKDEFDIVRDWINYHGYIFGYENLYIIDNYSTDGTYEILKTIPKINVFLKPDYKLKGTYMTDIISMYCQDAKIIYPLDFDEFIVYYNKEDNTISSNKDDIINYIQNLEERSVYKANYIMSKILKKNGYKKPIKNILYGTYLDYGINAKSFFNKKLFNGIIDHGNHYVTNDYIMTNICLVHYHYRNIEQIKKKIRNNVIGLGYSTNIVDLKNILKNNELCQGSHHIKDFILILEKNYNFPLHSKEENDIYLKPIINKIIETI